MKLLITMAWRNLWRNKRRTILTVMAIGFAAVLTILERSMAVGTWEYNIRNILELSSGYLQLQRPGYQENPSLNKAFAYPADIAPLLAAQPRLLGYAPRVTTEGLISIRQTSSGAAILGIDPVAEARVSRYLQRVNAGKFFQAGDPTGAVLGYKLLKNLRAAIGDTVVILAQGYDGVMGNQRFRICGTVRLGAPELDASLVLIDLRAAQELLATEGRVNIVALSVAKLTEVASMTERLRHALQGKGIDALPWQSVLPELQQQMEFDRTNDWIFLLILIVIVTFGILNTVLMSVTERFREFGVVLAIGMPNAKLVALVLLETALIALIGLLIGNILGYPLIAYLSVHPIQLGGDLGSFYEDFGFIPLLLTTARIGVVANSSMVIALISLAASIYPAYRVWKLHPLKGIRHT